MSETVYQFWRGRTTEARYRLSKDEQDKFLAKVQENKEQLRGKVLISCDCAWSTEVWQFWGVTEFPNVAALQKHIAFLIEIDWYRYIESETMLGTEFSG